ALGSLGVTRRAALWQASQAAKPAGELFEGMPSPPSPLPHAGEGGRRPGEGALRESPLREMSRAEETLADYDAMQLTAGPHLLQHFRRQLTRDGIVSARELKKLRNGSRVTTAGAVIVRQRPGTAKGFVFLTLEDETGLSQA